MNGRIRREVVCDSQGLNFLGHGRSVFEGLLRFLSIPVRYESGAVIGSCLPRAVTTSVGKFYSLRISFIEKTIS